MCFKVNLRWDRVILIQEVNFDIEITDHGCTGFKSNATPNCSIPWRLILTDTGEIIGFTVWKQALGMGLSDTKDQFWCWWGRWTDITDHCVTYYIAPMTLVTQDSGEKSLKNCSLYWRFTFKDTGRIVHLERALVAFLATPRPFLQWINYFKPNCTLWSRFKERDRVIQAITFYPDVPHNTTDHW